MKEVRFLANQAQLTMGAGKALKKPLSSSSDYCRFVFYLLVFNLRVLISKVPSCSHFWHHRAAVFSALPQGLGRSGFHLLMTQQGKNQLHRRGHRTRVGGSPEEISNQNPGFLAPPSFLCHTASVKAFLSIKEAELATWLSFTKAWVFSLAPQLLLP